MQFARPATVSLVPHATGTARPDDPAHDLMAVRRLVTSMEPVLDRAYRLPAGETLPDAIAELLNKLVTGTRPARRRKVA